MPLLPGPALRFSTRLCLGALLAGALTAVNVAWVHCPEALRGQQLGFVRLSSADHYAASHERGRWDPATLYRGPWHHALVLHYAVTNMLMADSIIWLSSLPRALLAWFVLGVMGGVSGHLLEYYGYWTGRLLPFGTSFGPVLYIPPTVVGLGAFMVEYLAGDGPSVFQKMVLAGSAGAALLLEAWTEGSFQRSTAWWHLWHALGVHLLPTLALAAAARGARSSSAGRPPGKCE